MTDVVLVKDVAEDSIELKEQLEYLGFCRVGEGTYEDEGFSVTVEGTIEFFGDTLIENDVAGASVILQTIYKPHKVVYVGGL